MNCMAKPEQETTIVKFIVVALVAYAIYSLLVTGVPLYQDLHDAKAEFKTMEEIRDSRPDAHEMLIVQEKTYCEELGYEYKYIQPFADETSIAVCVLPDGTECYPYMFMRGKCGEEYTYCETHGGTIKWDWLHCPYQQDCAICTTSEGYRCLEYEYFSGVCPP